MNRYLLDTNHLSAYLDRHVPLEQRIIDEETAVEFAEVFRELRMAGRVMSQFDLLIAALARQRRLILLTADQDFRPVAGLHVESWL